MKTATTTLGKRLRSCRGTRSAREIADVLGIKEQTLTGYERGRAEPNCTMLVSLAKHYGVSTDWLLGLTNISGKQLSRTDTVQVLARMVEIEADAQRRRQELLAALCQG